MKYGLLLVVWMALAGRLEQAIAQAPEAAPAWWTAREVLVSERPVDDYAILNQGQLKHFALAAFEEMNDQLPSGAGADLEALISNWSSPDGLGVLVPIPSKDAQDHAPVNIGQLKQVVALFWQKLAKEGIVVYSPWEAQGAGVADDFAYANIGQAKQCFKWDLGPAQVRNLAAQEAIGGALQLSWTGPGRAVSYSVFGISKYADVDKYELIASGVSGTSFVVDTAVRERFESFAIQGDSKGVWTISPPVTTPFSPTDPPPFDPLKDTDGDQVPDVKDGWPEDAEYAPPVVPPPGYVVIPLPSDVSWSAINERASVAGTSTRGAEFWKNGEMRLIVPRGVAVAMNDRDEVLVRYFRAPKENEYDVNIARWAWMEAWTRSFLAVPTPVGQINELFYPAAASGSQPPVVFESAPLVVEVFGVWSPEKGLQELSTVVEVASDGRWPRWTNGSKLFTIDAKWIDNQGNVYGDSRVCLLRGWGGDGILGADLVSQASDPDGTTDIWTPWKEQMRWKKGAGINVWVASQDRGAGGFAQAIQPSGLGIGVPNNRWFESVSSSGQALVASWNDASKAFQYELNGVRIHIDSRGAQVSNPMPFDGQAVVYVPASSNGETLLIQHDGNWHPRLVGTRKVCWGRWGSITYRVQGNQRVLPKDWWADSWLITDSGLALGVALKLNPDGSTKEGERGVTALLVPVTPTAPELYMLSGHERDVLHLSAGAGSDLQCEWRLKEASGAQGAFAKPGGEDWGAKIEACEAVFRTGISGSPSISGHARAQSPGKNILQLRIAGLLVLEAPIEVLEIKPRSDWWARPPNLKAMEGMAELRGITVHHSSFDLLSGRFEVNRIQMEHMGLLWNRFRHPSWADIAYHFLLDPTNPDPLAPLDLYEGRQLEGLGLKDGPFTKGSAVLLKNTEAGLNLCVLGDYSAKKRAFSDLHAKRLEKALTAFCRRYQLSDNVLRTHRGLSEWSPQVEVTQCPGWQVLLKLLPEGMRAAIRENLQ